MDELFATFDRELRRSGYLAMGGQSVDAILVSAPKQRNSDDQKQAIKAGRRAAEIWPDQPTKAAQKGTQARWTVKTGRRRERTGTQRRLPEIAIPVFGHKSHIAIDRAYGFIRSSAVTDAACHDGRRKGVHAANRQTASIEKKPAPTQPAGKIPATKPYSIDDPKSDSLLANPARARRRRRGAPPSRDRGPRAR